ncbi:Uncharacterised protein [Serratia fonticola]|uniref:Uncharacterized protein n=1 Tax=Serratia fonticola TaxID=47917 RepID=A0A4U9UW55_SERFO|nr:Uncharacterised protein [Serratia fonticola]
MVNGDAMATSRLLSKVYAGIAKTGPQTGHQPDRVKSPRKRLRKHHPDPAAGGTQHPPHHNALGDFLNQTASSKPAQIGALPIVVAVPTAIPVAFTRQRRPDYIAPCTPGTDYKPPVQMALCRNLLPFGAGRRRIFGLEVSKQQLEEQAGQYQPQCPSQ